MLLEVSKMLCTGRSLLLEEIVLEVCCGGTSGWLAGWITGWRPLGSARKSLDERLRVEVVVLLTSEHTREEPVCQQTSGLWWSQEKLSCTWHCFTREGD